MFNKKANLKGLINTIKIFLKMSLEHSMVPKNKKCAEYKILKDRVISKGHRTQPERAPNAKARTI